MNSSTQKTLKLLIEAREYAQKMQKGSAFVTDFKAMQLINHLIEELQQTLSENLKLQASAKYESAWKKAKKDLNK